MKKTILISALAVLGFISCKKDRTCTCRSEQISATSTNPSYTFNPSQTLITTTKYSKIKKNNSVIESCVDSEKETTSSTSFSSGGVVTYYTTTIVTKSTCRLN